MGVIPPSDGVVIWHVFRARMRAMRNRIVYASWGTRLAYAFLTVFLGVYLFAYAGVIVVLSQSHSSSFLVWYFGGGFFFMQFYLLSEAVRRMGRDEVLFSLPLSRRALFVVMLGDMAGSLTWFYIFLAPLFVGAAIALRPTPGRWILYGFAGALTWIFVTAIGMTLAIGGYRLLSSSRYVRFFRWLSTLGVCGVLVSFLFLGRAGRDVEEIPFETSPPRWFSFLPTVWMYDVIGTPREWRGLGGLVGGSAVSIFLAWMAFRRWFDVEKFFSAESPRRISFRSRVLVSRSPLTALALKEWRLLARNPTQWASLVISLGIWALSLWFSESSVSPAMRMNSVGFLGAFLFGVQRVEAEGMRIALLRVVLPGMGRLLGAKAAVTGVLLLPAMVISAVDWRERTLFLQDVLIAFPLTAGHATFSVGIGAIGPHFHAKNPFGSVRWPAMVALSFYFLMTVILSEIGGEGLLCLGGVAVGVATLGVGARRLARRDIV